ncbi:hypothetical protein C7M84_020316 [Penaeus vannamei]|uniref:Uncharacterized protein n=1 Tax=Penaeus vannamei TaxID=6689 RepID=A0A423SCA3_PENVA|nr:hypothetical protein C7M84_020316 [Penaeus vannamei]
MLSLSLHTHSLSFSLFIILLSLISPSLPLLLLFSPFLSFRSPHITLSLLLLLLSLSPFLSPHLLLFLSLSPFISPSSPPPSFLPIFHTPFPPPSLSHLPPFFPYPLPSSYFSFSPYLPFSPSLPSLTTHACLPAPPPNEYTTSELSSPVKLLGERASPEDVRAYRESSLFQAQLRRGRRRLGSLSLLSLSFPSNRPALLATSVLSFSLSFSSNCFRSPSTSTSSSLHLHQSFPLSLVLSPLSTTYFTLNLFLCPPLLSLAPPPSPFLSPFPPPSSLAPPSPPSLPLPREPNHGEMQSRDASGLAPGVQFSLLGEFRRRNGNQQGSKNNSCLLSLPGERDPRSQRALAGTAGSGTVRVAGATARRGKDARGGTGERG